MKAFTKLSLASLFICVLLLSCGRKQQEVPTAKTFAEKMDSLFSTVPDFSGVALVAEKGKPIYHKAFGYLNFETKVPMDTTSLFENLAAYWLLTEGGTKVPNSLIMNL